jgi:hypothetical protein
MIDLLYTSLMFMSIIFAHFRLPAIQEKTPLSCSLTNGKSSIFPGSKYSRNHANPILPVLARDNSLTYSILLTTKSAQSR